MSPHSPKLTPAEELKLIERWQKDREQKAAEHLMAAHRDRVRAEARRFLGFGVPKEDLMQEAWRGFFEAVDRYNPAKGTGLQTYAPFWVRWRLIEACAQELELSDDGRRALKTVLDAGEELAQELSRLPTRAKVVERALSRLLKQERHHGAESEEQHDSPGQKSRWNEPRARAAVEEVLDALERKKIPLWEEQAEKEGEKNVKTGAVVPSPEPGPQERLISCERIRAWCRSVCRALGEEQGQKFIIMFVLRELELEKVSEQALVDWLRKPNCQADSLWPHVCKAYGLNGCVPGSWDKVRALFATPPPTLATGALRQWYHHVKERLIRVGVLHP